MSDTPAKRKRDDTDMVDSGPAKVAKSALPSTPEKFPTSDAYDLIVQIKAGNGERAKVFEVHKGILCFYSGYFRAAFNGRWKEAQEGAIDMPSISPRIFKLFVHWAYSRHLEIAGKNDTGADYNLLLQLWVFGDAHEIPMLQNEVITILYRAVAQEWAVPDGFMISYAYENTMPESRLRLFLIDVFAGTCDSDFLKYEVARESWCKDALFDLLQIVWRGDWQRAGKEAFEKWDVCKYHVHEQGVKCVGS